MMDARFRGHAIEAFPSSGVDARLLTAVTFSLFGFIIGLWADDFQKLQVIPLMVVTPLIFLGGAFYSISMLPPAWQKITLFNPVVYLISGFRMCAQPTSTYS